MAKRMTVATLAQIVAKMDARVAALESEARPAPAKTDPQMQEAVSDLGKRLRAIEKVIGGDPEIGPVMRHASRGVYVPTKLLPSLDGMAGQYVHYRLPAGVQKGVVRVGRITGKGTKGEGYANLIVDLNGDEGWGDVAILVVKSAPYRTDAAPDSWRLGGVGAAPDAVRT